jgi:putative sigma-54 modulation protein
MDERSTLVSFKDLPTDERAREAIEKRCAHLAEEFQEITRIEITLSEDGAGYTVHGHVTGKGSDVDAQAEASDLAVGADRLLDKLERQLRKHHDKRIFTQRRTARRDPPKKRNPSQ